MEELKMTILKESQILKITKTPNPLVSSPFGKGLTSSKTKSNLEQTTSSLEKVSPLQKFKSTH